MAKGSSVALDLRTKVGEVALANPVMTAAGTSGHGAELGSYFDLAQLGAIVVKSLSVAPWPGNPAPRLRPLPGAMLNSVGLQGPGIEAFLSDELPALERSGARVVISIWGHKVQDYAAAAALLVDLPDCVVALEVNVSCPNIEDRSKMFAHSTTATREAVEAASGALPRWAKLSPNVSDLVEIAHGAFSGGASAVTLVNTVLGMEIDLERRRPSLGALGGGLSGSAIHPIAVRAVYDCRAAFPDAAIVGVGGIRSGEDAVELLMAGANAIQVGTATFADPRAPMRVLDGLVRWCRRAGVDRVGDLVGAAHR